jgi:hypothetical protein
MRNQPVKYFASVAVLLATLASPRPTQGVEIIHSGWDLFWTDPGTTLFNGVPFQGVPLWYYDFQDGNGPRWVGETDTILHRPGVSNTAGFGNPNPWPGVEMVAWQLRSVIPVNMGYGPGYYYLTLSNNAAAQVSASSVIFSNANNGSFTDTLDVNFQLGYGSLTNVVAYDWCRMENSFDTWDRDAGTNAALRIAGINYLLNGIDTTEDFWPDPVSHYASGSGYVHSVINVVPEPSHFVLVGLGLLSLALKTRRGRK